MQVTAADITLLYLPNTGFVAVTNSNDDIMDVELTTEYRLVALIMNIFAAIFPCCFLGTLDIEEQGVVYHIARSQIQKSLDWDGENACETADDLKQIALAYFLSQQFPLRNLPMSAQGEFYVSDTADLLVQEFKALKGRTEKKSGYHVYLDFKAPNHFDLEIDPKGTANQEIAVPSAKSSCDCCRSGFEHTYKNSPHEFCCSLTVEISKYEMMAVFSKSGNLLLVPDTRNHAVDPEDYPHLFALDDKKLKDTFAALLTALNFIRKKYPSYEADVEWHVGVDGSQTVGILHTRIQSLPK